MYLVIMTWCLVSAKSSSTEEMSTFAACLRRHCWNPRLAHSPPGEAQCGPDTRSSRVAWRLLLSNAAVRAVHDYSSRIDIRSTTPSRIATYALQRNSGCTLSQLQ